LEGGAARISGLGAWRFSVKDPDCPKVGHFGREGITQVDDLCWSRKVSRKKLGVQVDEQGVGIPLSLRIGRHGRHREPR
jgi:hypothetical protein